MHLKCFDLMLHYFQPELQLMALSVLITGPLTADIQFKNTIAFVTRTEK